MVSTASGKIAPCPDANWNAYVLAFRDYLAQCRTALDASRQAYEDANSEHKDRDVAKGQQRTKATSKGLGLPREAASHRSEHVYLLAAGASRECVTLPYPTVTGYRPPLWASMNEVEDKPSRKRRAA